MPKASKAERELILNKYGQRCAYCGRELVLKTMQVDHLKPIMRKSIYQNGKSVKADGCYFPEHDTLENKMPSCRLCNYHKHTFSLEEFINEIQKKVERIKSSNIKLLEQYGLINFNQCDTVEFYFEKYMRTMVWDK